jgi:AraC family transcriptional activator of pyochelin receptor
MTSNRPCPWAINAYEIVERCPAELGSGSKRWISLREISLLIHDYEFHQDVEVRHCQDEEGLEFGFQLQGGSYAHRCAGHNFVQSGPSLRSSTVRKSGERNLQIDLHLESVEYLNRFVAGERDGASEQIRRLLSRPEQLAYTQVDTTTAEMQAALEQVLHCPFQGLTRQIYLEGQCWQLIALKLNQLSGSQACVTSRQLNHDDIDRIHEAKAILTRQWQAPPSLLELARQVGLNDYKLKLGFREVFGTTAFGYLWEFRMEQARQLLMEGRHNIKQVSMKVGYARQSSFSASFYKRYGVTPKAYQAKVRAIGKKSV